jgi:hypothetical protein
VERLELEAKLKFIIKENEGLHKDLVEVKEAGR